MRKLILRLLILTLSCLAAQAVCQNSNSPIYSEIIPTSSGLPYDPATDFRESFQAPNGKTVDVLVKGPVGTGTYSRAMKPGETPDIYFPAVVAEAVKANAHHLVIPNGVYAFRGPKLCTDLQSPSCSLPSSCNVNQYWNCNPHWTIGQYPQGQVTVPDSVSDLDIDFSGSELDFSAPIIGIWILEAQRLRFRNVILDWPSLPIASIGTIEADPLNPGHNELVIDPKFPVHDRYQGGPVQIQAVDVWDDSKSSKDAPGTFDRSANNTFETYFIFGNAPQPTYVGKTSTGGSAFSCKSCNFQNSPTDPTCNFFLGCANFDLFSPGTRVIARHYTYNGLAVLVNWSNDIDFENVKLRTGPGIGISVSNNGGYRGFRFHNSKVKRGPGRVISTASDAINLGLQADLILDGNDVGYQGDDSINIHSTTESIAAVNGTQVTVAGICDPDPMDNPILGDSLAFFDANFAYMGTAKVVAIDSSVCGTPIVTLDHAIQGLSTTDSLYDLTQQAMARYVVRDNVMHDCRCHGVLVNAPYGLIDHNLMYNNSAGGISLYGGAGLGPGSTNMTISNNAIGSPGLWAQDNGAISAAAFNTDGNPAARPVFEKLRMTNNVVTDSPGPAAIITSTLDLTFANNTIRNTNLISTGPVNYGTLSSLDSILFDQSSHGTLCGNTKTGKTTGPTGIDPSSKKILLEATCAATGQ